MNRKQRIHSAELRRLDHIARSLDRIGDAMERLHEVVVSGNNNRIIEAGGDIIAKGGGRVSSDINQTVGRDGDNITQGNDNTLASAGNDYAAVAGSGTATVNSRNRTQNFNDEVSGASMPMGDLRKIDKRDIATYGENSQGVVDGAVNYNNLPNKPGTG